MGTILEEFALRDVHATYPSAGCKHVGTHWQWQISCM